MSLPEVSIVLPTYKEKENLAILLPEINHTFSDVTREIIVVDDDSRDGTNELITELAAAGMPVRVLWRAKKEGIGAALRAGYDAAQGEYILSSDADLSFAVSDMRRLYQKIKEGFDLVVGYRHGGEGKYERHTLAVRVKYFISYSGNWVVRTLSRLPVRDFSANFRIMRRVAWQQIGTQEKTNTLLFEMIVKIFRRGFKLAEIPVTFTERRFGQSKLQLWKEAPKFLWRFLRYTFLPAQLLINKSAEFWDDYYREFHTVPWTDWVLMAKYIKGEMRVLDVGCSSGVSAKHYQDFTTGKITGIDASPQAIARAQQDNPAGNFLVGDATQLSFPNASFEVVVSVELVEHLSNPQDYFLEAARVCVPGGLLITQTPNYPIKRLYDFLGWMRGKRSLTDDPTHVSFFNCRKLQVALSRAGWNVAEITGRNLLGQSRFKFLSKLRSTCWGKILAQKIIVVARKPITTIT